MFVCTLYGFILDICLKTTEIELKINIFVVGGLYLHDMFYYLS